MLRCIIMCIITLGIFIAGCANDVGGSDLTDLFDKREIAKVEENINGKQISYGYALSPIFADVKKILDDNFKSINSSDDISLYDSENNGLTVLLTDEWQGDGGNWDKVDFDIQCIIYVYHGHSDYIDEMRAMWLSYLK